MGTNFSCCSLKYVYTNLAMNTGMRFENLTNHFKLNENYV